MKVALHSIKLFAVVLAALVLVLVVFGWRSSSQARAAMLESDAAFNAGEIRPATAHARRAATLYVPGAPHVDQAYARLFAIARGAEAAGKPELAREAWQAVRAAAMETRTLVVARHRELTQADANLARLRTYSALADRRSGLLEREPGDTAPRLETAATHQAAVAWPGLFGLGGLILAFGWSALRWRPSERSVAWLSKSRPDA